MRTPFPAVSLLVLMAIVGCETPTSAPVNSARFNYIDGPDDLLNVDRFEARYSISIIDPETGYRAMGGLPTVPSSHVLCNQFGFTGTERYQFVPMQTIGGEEEPYVHIMNADDVNLHVFLISTFAGFCRSTVYAQGVGHFASADNDQTFSGERWNVWSFHLVGDVTVLSTGEVKHLNAFTVSRARPGEPYRLITNKVEVY